MSQLFERYEEHLKGDLRNPEEAAAYIKAAAEDGTEKMLLLALRVAKAYGIAEIACCTALRKG